MPVRLTTISTGSALRRANERFKSMSWNDMKAYLDEVENHPSVETPASGRGPLDDQGQIDHHNEFIGNGPGGFFPEIPAELKNDIMRAAIIQALRVALYIDFNEDGTGNTPRESALPIVGYWISGSQTFEAYVDRSDAEVHIFLVTPDPAPPLDPPSPDSAREEPMWHCAAPARVQAMRDRAPSCAYREPVEMPEGLLAECQQVISD